MKVDLSKVIIGFDGKPLVNKMEGVPAVLPDGTPVLLKYGLKVKNSAGKEIELIEDQEERNIGSLLLECVTSPLKKDSDQTAEERIRLFELAQLIHKNKGKSITLKAEDVVELKARALVLFIDPQIFAGVKDAIDPAK